MYDPSGLCAQGFFPCVLIHVTELHSFSSISIHLYMLTNLCIGLVSYCNLPLIINTFMLVKNGGIQHFSQIHYRFNDSKLMKYNSVSSNLATDGVR